MSDDRFDEWKLTGKWRVDIEWPEEISLLKEDSQLRKLIRKSEDGNKLVVTDVDVSADEKTNAYITNITLQTTPWFELYSQWQTWTNALTNVYPVVLQEIETELKKYYSKLDPELQEQILCEIDADELSLAVTAYSAFPDSTILNVLIDIHNSKLTVKTYRYDILEEIWDALFQRYQLV